MYVCMHAGVGFFIFIKKADLSVCYMPRHPEEERCSKIQNQALQTLLEMVYVLGVDHLQCCLRSLIFYI